MACQIEVVAGAFEPPAWWESALNVYVYSMAQSEIYHGPQSVFELGPQGITINSAISAVPFRFIPWTAVGRLEGWDS
jgi:hypothetical protein